MTTSRQAPTFMVGTVSITYLLGFCNPPAVDSRAMVTDSSRVEPSLDRYQRHGKRAVLHGESNHVSVRIAQSHGGPRIMRGT
jgi:hypothetical protein